MSINDGAERIALVRTAANKIHYSLFINARIDSWLRGENTDPEHLIFRANAYLAAGVKRVSRGSFFAEQAYGVTQAGIKHFVQNGLLQNSDQEKLSYTELNVLLNSLSIGDLND